MADEFTFVLGGETYRPALDLNASMCIQRELHITHELLVEKLFKASTPSYERLDLLRVLVWAMIVTDCGRRRIPHPHVTDIGTLFQEDPTAIIGQINKFLGIEDGTKDSLAPFVPTPTPVVEKMIELAAIQANESVVDLGAGDGRLLLAAVDVKEGVTCTGYETHPERSKALIAMFAAHPKSKQLTVATVDIRKASIRQADVVFMYLLPSSNEELKAKLEAELKPGARIISHDFDMPGWEAEEMTRVKADGRSHLVYLWRRP